MLIIQNLLSLFLTGFYIVLLLDYVIFLFMDFWILILRLSGYTADYKALFSVQQWYHMKISINLVIIIFYMYSQKGPLCKTTGAFFFLTNWVV